MSALTDLTAAQAVAGVRAGDVDPGELFAAYRERSAADELNAYVWVAGDAPAPALDGDAPLAGLPLAVKDLFCTEGAPSQSGSKVLEDYRPPYTATVVRRLYDAGASLLGKTNMDEFAMGSSNENSAYGPVLNPWDRTRVPGGSSGGSAAAVAAGLAPWALGTDTGGSIRQPAALCGIVGLKPTYGTVSRYGMIAFASSLDQAGPLTRDVTDAALLFRHMVGHDGCDATSLQHPEEIVLPTRTDLRGVRLGVPEELSGEGIEPGVLANFHATLDRARELGATVEPMRLPHAPHALSAYYVLAPAECSSNLARYDGVRFGLRSGGDQDLVGMYTGPATTASAPRSSGGIMLGTYALSSGLLRRVLRARAEVRTKISEDFPRGVRAASTSSSPRRRRRSPSSSGRRPATAGRCTSTTYCTVPMSLAGIPAISIPSGLVDGLRVGFQLAGPAFSENRILDAAVRARGSPSGSTEPGPRMSTEYEPVIGLEIHVQLGTRTKMFCSCALSFGEPPNTRTCPVCLGLPGSLPVVNARAVHFALMIGMALGSELAERSIFHRKNYFYPDLPKGYQISQYDEPLCKGGRLGDVALTRVHLEEDAAKLSHASATGRIAASDASVVDFNRGGTPLVEIVTEPEVRSAEHAREWLTLLRETLRQLGVSDVDMSQGSLRCDANVSIRPVGSEAFGTKTELKNMNSFAFLERGVRAEIARQTAIKQGGGEVLQETLHFDPRTESITSLRSKEEAHDYRYFPEPDLVPVTITDQMLTAARAELPELPLARAERYEGELGLSPASARDLAFRPELAARFDSAVADDGVQAQAVANLMLNEPDHALAAEPTAVAELVRMVDAKAVTAGNARVVLERLATSGGDPARIVEAEGLGAMGGGDELAPVVAAALAANADAADKIRGGNMKAIGPIIGHVMRETKGRADGGEVTRLVREQLGV
jgi:aspartyl-tRNA(Asn)/glutamyl-tRNA(Gln) amidotransferase subunit B